MLFVLLTAYATLFAATRIVEQTELAAVVLVALLILLPAVIVVALALASPESPRNLLRTYFAWPGISTVVVWSLLGIVGMVAAIVLSNVLRAVTGASTEAGEAAFPSFAILIMAATWGPLVEEIIFRGWGVLWVQRHYPRWTVAAVLGSSIAFALAHQASGAFSVSHLFIGLVYAGIAAKTRSLWPSLIVHVFGNAATLLLVWLVLFR